MPLNNNEAHIQSITFGDNGIEIVYAEPRDIENLEATGGILRTRVVLCPARYVEEELGELIDDASQLLDKILLIERTPSAGSFRR